MSELIRIKICSAPLVYAHIKPRDLRKLTGWDRLGGLEYDRKIVMLYAIANVTRPPYMSFDLPCDMGRIHNRMFSMSTCPCFPIEKFPKGTYSAYWYEHNALKLPLPYKDGSIVTINIYTHGGSIIKYRPIRYLVN